MIWTLVKLSLGEIRRNVLRSFLTTLGIIIGVASIIVVLALGNGATRSIRDQIGALGAGIVLIQPRQPQTPGLAGAALRFFKEGDVEAIREQLDGVRAIAGIVQVGALAVANTQSWPTTVRGTTNEFFLARQWTMAQGRSFLPLEEASGKAVCIIGDTVRRSLFRDDDPLGRGIRMGNATCTVVGVMTARGQGGFGEDQDDVIVLPLKLVQRRFTGSREVRSILLALNAEIDSEPFKASLVSLLRERRNLSPTQEDDFALLDPKQISETITSTTRVLTVLVAGIAGVSLLVGGIGIMNIMLVSVTERTREIGTRLAIGAFEKDVLLQFLVEATVLASLGGILGIAIGTITASGIGFIGQLPTVFDPTVALFSFIFSAFIGVSFGYLPAKKASSLNPIEALRYE
jgi:putative ABC transport system permease protein